MNSREAEVLAGHVLLKELIPKLPGRVRALSLDVNAWLITVHAYQDGTLEEEIFDSIEQATAVLPEQLPPRAAEAW